MKHRITEAQLRKLVYSQVKRLAEAPEQLSLPGMGTNQMDQADKTRLAKIQNIIRPMLGDKASQLAPAFSKIAKGESDDLTNSDQGALAALAILFIKGTIDKSKLDEIIRIVKISAADAAKDAKEAEKQQTAAK